MEQNDKVPQIRRLGQRLVDAGYLSQEQLLEALAQQKEKGGLLGDILLEIGVLAKDQLDTFFRDNATVWSAERMLYEGILTREQLLKALYFQEENGGRIGNAVVALGFATQETIDAFFLKNAAASAPQRLGDMLMKEGAITQEELDRALLFQRNSGGQLGEILVSMRLVSSDSLYRALATQMRLGRIGTKLDLSESKRLPYRAALEYNAIIINCRTDAYILAVHKPLTQAALERVRMHLDKPVEQVLATMEEIERLWELVYQSEESDQSLYQLFKKQHTNSAIVTFTRMQRIAGIAILILLTLCIMMDYHATLLAISIILQCLYVLFTALKTAILIRGLNKRRQICYTKEQVDAINERKLPVYTLLIPVYREAGIAPHIAKRLNSLDYPKHKLDIRILLEEDDAETIAAFRALDLPSHFTLLVVPDTKPHTKPKACNYGLIRARGEYTVIYDAEDIPDADQLKKVYLAFQALPESYVCIQSKLNYFNSNQNMLTQWFTQEYSTWFDVLLVGIMSMDMPIPLGGTSNHFKTKFLRDVGAWDPFNVTEDADLGIRLYKMNYHTAVLDSHTWEEANSKVKNWIRQRSRWIKGYMQTWLVHMRKPGKLYKELGLKGFVGYQAMVLGTPLVPLLNPIFWVMLIAGYLYQEGFVASMFPGVIYYIAALQLFLGNFLFVYSNITGVYEVIRKSEERGKMHISYAIVFSGILLPIYWLLMSVAAYKALFQLINKPFYWEKTQHGLTKQTTLQTVK